MSAPHAPRKIPTGLRIIAIVKLISAFLLSAVGFGLFHIMGGDLGSTLGQFVHQLHLDPENKVVVKVLADISGVSKRELKAIDAGTFLYALLYIIEGIGLLMAKHWAEYLTILATSSFVPLELYEAIKKFSFIRASVLVLNVGIVIYLVYRLLADRRALKALPGSPDGAV